MAIELDCHGKVIHRLLLQIQLGEVTLSRVTLALVTCPLTGDLTSPPGCVGAW